MQDPKTVLVPTRDLDRLARAFDVLDAHATLTHRYRKLIVDSRALLVTDRVRLTQARGMAKKLLVLVKAAGPDFPDSLDVDARAALDAGLDQAESLVRDAWGS